MGLLDALFSPDSGGGGLLDLLRNSALNQQAPAGLPSDQAQYGGQMPSAMPPMFAQQPQQPQPQINDAQSMASAPWPVGPVGAPSQAGPPMPVPQQPPAPIMAQSAQPQPQMQPQPAPAQQPAPQDAGTGIGDRLGAGFRGMAANMTGGPLGMLAGGMAGLAGMGKGTEEQQNAKKMGFAASALLQKGVDPATVQAAVNNPEIMKTLVTQTFGPQTVTALGNGYVADKSGKITRAYEPEDKIPSGFAKDDQGNMKFIPGGPADPAYARLLAAKSADPNAVFVLGKGGELYKKDAQGNVTVVHKNEGDGDRPMLSEDGQSLLADRILNGEKGVTAGFARSKADMSGIYNKVAEKAKERGVDAGDILSNINNEYAAASAARSFGGMTAKQETYSNTAAKAIDIAEKASEAVPRTTWVPINKAILAYREKSGDPKVAALGQSLETLTQEYARAVGGGHGTVSDKEEAREYLAKAQTHEQLVARFNIMRQEIARGRESVGESAAHVGQIYRNNIRKGSALPEPGTKAADELAGAPKTPVQVDGYTITEH